jgi:hypothetical protein
MQDSPFPNSIRLQAGFDRKTATVSSNLRVRHASRLHQPSHLAHEGALHKERIPSSSAWGFMIMITHSPAPAAYLPSGLP